MKLKYTRRETIVNKGFVNPRKFILNGTIYIYLDKISFGSKFAY